MDMAALLEELQRHPTCLIHPPVGLPRVRPLHTLPDDVVTFYRLCGGLDLFGDSNTPTLVVSPNDFVAANPVIAFTEEGYDDISDAWYLLARIENGEYIVIDCDSQRLGRCYDGNHETYGLVGQTPVIAASFGEFLERTLRAGTDGYYWTQPHFRPLGDAYD
jgi:hypothetical protein